MQSLHGTNRTAPVEFSHLLVHILQVAVQTVQNITPTSRYVTAIITLYHYAVNISMATQLITIKTGPNIRIEFISHCASDPIYGKLAEGKESERQRHVQEAFTKLFLVDDPRRYVNLTLTSGNERVGSRSYVEQAHQADTT